ncbi:MAG: ribonuclease R, partial [Planctomycetota bacterium]|nr:ribonuclease R [Planctomycetota bacterium]
KHLVMKPKQPKKTKGEVIGSFRKTTAGFGVVRTQADTPVYGITDVHIPSQNCLDAASGDRVRIRVTRKRPGRDIPYGGRIEEIVERRTHRFVGTFFEEVGYGYVQIDGKEFNEPILAEDSAAKNCHEGDKVVLEMVRFPSSHTEGEGVIVEVLGPHGQPGVDTQLIMNQYGLEPGFSEAVLDCARFEADQFDESITGTRIDLTEETIVTIDPKDARDFDDAISLQKIANGHWLLGVHIADVSHFVKPNTVLDDEAYNRGTSVYLPDRVIPMLPEIISNNLASLQPDRVRYALSAMIEFTPDGAPVKTKVQQTAIQSKRRFTYEEVDDFLQRPVAWRRKLDHDTFDLLERMHQLAMRLRSRRIRDGAIELHLPEIRVEIDGQGKVSGAKVSRHTESHQVIEEFMLAANEAVARKFNDLELPFLRRVHPQPDSRKFDDLTDFVNGIGIHCDSLQSRFEIQRLVNRVKGKPQQTAVNFALLKSMPKAKYSPEEEGHYALGSSAYCHFTSPIRRYPDLVIHRMVTAIAQGRKPSVDQQTLARIGDDCSAREENAERAERDLTKLKLLGYFSDKIGMKMAAVITGVKRRGFFAQGIDLPAEGFVNVFSLPRDRYHFDSTAMILSGYHPENIFQLGDRVNVRVAAVDLNRRELDFELDQPETNRRSRSRRDPVPKSRGRRHSPDDRPKSRQGHSGSTSKPKRSKKRSKSRKRK